MKRVGGRIYLHVSGLSALEAPIQQRVEQAVALVNARGDVDFNVLKVDMQGDTVSLLSYPEFFSSGFPSLKRSWTVLLASRRVAYRTYEESLNPPVLHRKELLLPRGHVEYVKFAALTRDAEELGLFEDTLTIGFREAWERLLAERGYQVVGNSLVPIANAEFGADRIGNDDGPLEIFRHRTALARSTVSAPVQALLRYDLVGPDHSVFDYGCGRGDDIRALTSIGIRASGWDPHFANSQNKVASDFVNLGFVINVIEDFGERVQALQDAYALAGKALAVATMLSSNEEAPGRPFRDGYITSRNTFQKYFTQSELAGFISHVLDEEPIPASPGVFLVFRDKSLEQRFLAGRNRSAGLITRLRKIERQNRPAPARTPCDRDFERYATHESELNRLWETWLALGRPPEEDEAPNASALAAGFGSIGRAIRFLVRHKDAELLELARNARRQDLLVYFALQQLRGIARYKQLETRLQRDVKAFFGDYATAQSEARTLLLSARAPENLHAECLTAAERGLGWMDEDRSLQLQTSLIERLSPLLRVYVGCASILYGDIQNADLVKIHIRSGKLSLMRFDRFAESPLPRMIERVKVNLRTQAVDIFQYGEGYEPPYLYFKSRYLDEESPLFGEQAAFEMQLEEAGLLDFSGYGPTAREFDQLLARRRLEISDFRLIPSRTIPSLDEPCGERFIYRQLMECGETQRQTMIANLPNESESYNALYDLAKNILDPVIEYFGPIELTYGFASSELTRQIKGRIEPKLDQHCAHERNRRGEPICSRLGAAVDFLVRDESMLDVAEWIAENLPFDRLYYYGPDRPIHVSYGPEQSRQFVEMRLTESGKLVPHSRRPT